MTINDLIKKISTDKKFARKFKRLADQLCAHRESLISDKLFDDKVTKRFMKSWAEFYKTFAFDPISLAALSVPQIKDRAGYCTKPTTTGQLTVFTGTQTAALYDIGKGKQSKTAAKSKPKATKKKASKVK